ncbi:hypothetical protein WOLCODRAFT_138295 [Wolfiporia cocos MD-104 SS10]|uniref:Secreted protein n=1 Tax=Wolfiporia cocos (strain MD-104) TaxID=742152 RepID=A0A2H3JTM7_WOLCO|nr:hypothetical protein WOLCODRAFT_138295 [Wolfiporia cocos MD-104 SS10]
MSPYFGTIFCIICVIFTSWAAVCMSYCRAAALAPAPGPGSSRAPRVLAVGVSVYCTPQPYSSLSPRVPFATCRYTIHVHQMIAPTAVH